MDNKIQELTDKIYHEGVEKGNDEAQRIIQNAKEEAQRIIAEAEKNAQVIITAAEKKATEAKENLESEIKLFANQSVNALKSEITNLLLNQSIDEAIKGFVSDKEYLYKFIVSLASKWSETETVKISIENADDLKKYFLQNAKDLLNKGVKIENVNGINTSFSISPANGLYKVNFGEEEFKNYFKEFLRPQLVEILF